ncbi:calmodulin-like 5 [Umbelopsis sp. PMI_123]|nr:calmodulin-like 5 [Umbelopsis sp. PMI_123]
MFSEVFKIFDKNSDGNISIEEFTQVLEHLGVTSGESEAKIIVKRVGRQNSSSINFEEFVDAVSAATQQQDLPCHEEQELRACFRAFDKNGDGRISLDELSLAMKELGENMTQDELEAMMRDGDADNDGMIDFEEFKRLMPTA